MPTLSALDAALLQPERALPALRRLGNGQIVKAGSSPFRVVGTDSVVFQLRQPNGRVLALRCSLSDTLDRTFLDRYRALATDSKLAQIRDMGDGPILRQVTALRDGIVAADHTGAETVWPLVAMEWVLGPTLVTAVDRASLAGDRAYLSQLAERWLAVAESLDQAGFRHGDLTADNIMVRPGASLVLVDYDTAVWPGSPVAPVPRGTPGYAHPRKEPVPLDQRDDFPALVLYTSLRVLANHPDLRSHYGEPPVKPGAALLFTNWDLGNAHASRLFRHLKSVVSDPKTAWLVQVLREAAEAPPVEVPRFRDVLHELRGALGRPATPVRTAPPRPARPSDQEAQPVGEPGWRTDLRRESVPEKPAAPKPLSAAEANRQRVERLLDTDDEQGALRWWTSRGMAADAEAVRQLGQRIAEAERNDAIRRAQQAAQSNDTVTFLQLWEEYDLEHHPRTQKLTPVAEVARRRRDVANRIRAALDRGDTATVARFWAALRGDSLVSDIAIRAADALQVHYGREIGKIMADGTDEELVNVVAEAERSGVVITGQMRRAVRAATNRIQIRAQLQAAIDADDRTMLADLLISGRLAEISDITPEAQRAALRALAWPHLERAIERDSDEAILGSYDPELFDPLPGEPDPLTEAQRARVELAVLRLDWIARVRDALRRRDTAFLLEAFTVVPEGALDRLSPVERGRIERLTSREEAVLLLEDALERGVDEEILAALAQVTRSGATLPQALDWAAVRGVVDRVTLADAIQKALDAQPPDYSRLARLLPAARAAAEADPTIEQEIDFAKLEREVLRAAHLNRLRSAIQRGDKAAIRDAAKPDPFGVLELLTIQELRIVEAAGVSLEGTGRYSLVHQETVAR